MFRCCKCNESRKSAKMICEDCLREKELTDCFIHGAQDEVQNHLKNGKTVYGTIFGVSVKIVPDR